MPLVFSLEILNFSTKQVVSVCEKKIPKQPKDIFHIDVFDGVLDYGSAGGCHVGFLVLLDT